MRPSAIKHHPSTSPLTDDQIDRNVWRSCPCWSCRRRRTWRTCIDVLTGLAIAAAVALGVVELARGQELHSVHAYGGVLPAGGAESDHLVFTPLYAARISPENRVPTWVAYLLTPAMMDSRNILARNWHSDWGEITLESSDYAGGGYDRGHLVPISAVAGSPHGHFANDFVAIAPQTPDLNQGPWLRLESFVQELAIEHGRLHVAAGCLWEEEREGLPAADESHRVPSHCWMVVTTPAGEQIAWLLPQRIDRDADFWQFAVTLRELEQRTGLTF